MANNNDMITLNIYNQPPPNPADETSEDLNQTEPDQNPNLNTEKPRIINKIYKDNKRNIQPNNYYSDPRLNIRNKNYNIQNQVPIMAVPPQYPQPINRQIIVNPPPVGTPMASPMMVPYNMQYGQPVVIQENQLNNEARMVNNAPKTIIIKEEERIPKRNRIEDDCCAGCLAGCASCLAICCLMGLCCPGPHGPPHRHHRRW